MEQRHTARTDRPGDGSGGSGRDAGGDDGGLTAHLENCLGPLREAIRGVAGRDGVPAYDLATYDLEPKGLPVRTVVTNGLRFQPLTAPKPQELLCSLWSGHAESAAYLVATTADHVVLTGRGILPGTVLAHDDPVVPGTAIVGVLGFTSPWFGGGLDFHTDEAGDIRTQLVTLLPVTGPEADFVRDRGHDGVDALWERFRERRLNVFDARRPSAV